MGQYIDKDRRILHTSNKQVINEIDTSRKISKIFALKNIDNKRIVFFTQYITSASQYGLITNPSALTINLNAGSALFNGQTVTWTSQTIDVPSAIYGIIGIDYQSNLVVFNTGLVKNVIPICIVGSSVNTIPFIYMFSVYGTYVCYTYQTLVDGSWKWSNEPTFIIGSGSDVTFSDIDNDKKYITFIRNGSALRRLLTDSTASDWDFYPDYIDNANVRYIMPNDKALQISNTPNGCITSSTANTKFSTNTGTFNTPTVTVNNPFGTLRYVYTIRLPLFNPYFNVIKKYLPNNYTVFNENGDVQYANNINNAELRAVEVTNNTQVTLQVDGKFSPIESPNYLENILTILSVNINPINVSPTSTSLELEAVSECSNSVSSINPTFTTFGEIFYEYSTSIDVNSSKISTAMSGVVPTFSTFGEIFYEYSTSIDTLLPSISSAVSVVPITFSVSG